MCYYNLHCTDEETGTKQGYLLAYDLTVREQWSQDLKSGSPAHSLIVHHHTLLLAPVIMSCSFFLVIRNLGKGMGCT